MPGDLAVRAMNAVARWPQRLRYFDLRIAGHSDNEAARLAWEEFRSKSYDQMFALGLQAFYEGDSISGLGKRGESWLRHHHPKRTPWLGDVWLEEHDA